MSQLGSGSAPERGDAQNDGDLGAVETPEQTPSPRHSKHTDSGYITSDYASSTGEAHGHLDPDTDDEDAEDAEKSGRHGQQQQQQEQQLRPTVCVFYLQGRCHHGSACRFAHDLAAEAPPCRFYTRGQECRYGDRCRFAHDPDARQRWAEGAGRGGGGRSGRGQGRGYGRGRGGYGSGGGRTGAGGYDFAAEFIIGRVLAKEAGLLDSEGYGSDATYEDELDERTCNMGFTRGEMDELLCQGVKPWDEDAWDVLAALHDYD